MELKELLERVTGGDYDGHEAEIVNAVRLRVAAGAVKFAWRIDYDGLDITEENLTVGEAKRVEDILGVSVYNAAPAGSAENISAYLSAVLMSRKGMTLADAQAQVDAEPIKSLLGLVSDYTLVDPPKDSGDQNSP